MEINLSNYQAYFLDYCEGNLNAAQIAGLKVFLKEHPELQAELDEFENITLEPEISTVFNQKDLLKKQLIEAIPPLNEQNYREYFVYEIDGELSDTESAAVKSFLNTNPHLYAEFEAFSQTVLSTDVEIIEYPDKNSLKRTAFIAKSKYSLAWSFSIAASLLIIFGLTFIFIEKKADRVAKLASNSDVSIKIKSFVPLNNEESDNTQTENIDNKTNTLSYYHSSTKKIELLPVSSVKHIENTHSYELAYIVIPEKIEETKLVIVSELDDLVQNEPMVEQSFTSMAWHKISNLFQRDRVKDSVQNTVDVWDFANAGVVGLNKITENEFQLLKQRDQNGELVGVKLVGKNFAISKKVRNKK